ncbi:type I polyketide synthase, partial [Micromonospora sp. DT201]|uniref:type I polyketide synthase n=1 Tax=Micromonospora sp. DT201 TaxID=3393442 RepID=UPI003CED8E05
ENGHHPFTIHSHTNGNWTQHATGVLGTAVTTVTADLKEWPPPGAEAVQIDGLYSRLHGLGLHYGPTFRGLRRAWRSGDDIYVEIRQDDGEESSAAGYQVHPALLDAVLHALGLYGGTEPHLPFGWNGVALHGTGTAVLRARLTPVGERSYALTVADDTGQGVLSVAALTTRPVAVRQIEDALAGRDVPLLRLDWQPVPVGDAADPAEHHRVTGGHGAAATARQVLAVLQQWLAADRPAADRLAVVTKGALAAVPGDDVRDLDAAPVWGLIRSAQSEHPGRFAVVDLDDDEASLRALPAALASAEPQLAIRQGEAYAPRLVPVGAVPSPDTSALDPDGTVLITGGTGALGAHVAKRLAVRHGIRHLLLVSRSGPAAPGAEALRADLAALGAETTFAACDVADRAALVEVLNAVPPERPVTAIVHTSGVLRDALLTEQSDVHLDAVLPAKADAAAHLHELTRDDPRVRKFVLFSSAAATFGALGQANYAAANTYLDALAHHRRSLGLPATSIAWGLWGESGGMAAHLSDADLSRLRRAGLPPLTDAQGLNLLDAALSTDVPHVVAIRVDTAGTELPPLLRYLAPALPRTPQRRTPLAGVREHLMDLPADERGSALRRHVVEQVSVALGHETPASVGQHVPLGELGLDSLIAVELRNRLSETTGLRLPASLTFDYTTVDALGDFLYEQLFPPEPGGDVFTHLDQLATALAGATLDATGRAGVAERLRGLLQEYDTQTAANESVAGEIESASADELFALINREFGKS